MNIPARFYHPDLRSSGVYAIRNLQSGKVYIGSAKNLSLRWRGHYRHLSKGTHHCSHLQRAWAKYGADAFAFEVIETCELGQLREREQSAIDLVPVGERYNSSPTAGSLLGFKHSPEAVERLRRRMTGYKFSEEVKQRARERCAGRCVRGSGWKMTDAQKAKLSAARKGKPLNPEHAERCRQNLKQVREKFGVRPWTEQRRVNFSKMKRVLSDAQIAEAKQRFLSGETMDEIARSFGVSRGPVSRAVRGRYLSDQSAPVTREIKKRNYAEGPNGRTPWNKGLPGKPITEEHKNKLRALFSGKPISAERREKLVVAANRPEAREARRLRMLGNQNTKGRRLSEEHKEAIGARFRGKTLSQETRDRMAIAQRKVAAAKSAATKGKPWSAARRAALTDEVREKMSAKQRGKPATATQLEALDRGRRSRVGQRKPFMSRAPWSPEVRASRMAAIAAKKLRGGPDWTGLLRKSRRLAKEIDRDYEQLMGFLSEVRRSREKLQAAQ